MARRWRNGGRPVVALTIGVLASLGVHLVQPAAAGPSRVVASVSAEGQPVARLPVEPWSDDFEDAPLRRGAPFFIAVNTTGATRQACEPRHAEERGGKSMWLRWVSRGTGVVVLNTNGSEFDTLLAVYTGSDLCHLTEVASDNDSGAGLNSQLRFTARANRVYRIVVDGLERDEGYGNVRLRRV